MKRSLLALLLLAGLAAPAQVTLKIATLLPENTAGFRILKGMADDWARLSSGQVKVVLYPGGRQGDEPDVVRKLRLGTLQGALLATPGLSEIDRSVYAVSLPLAFDSYEEAYAVLEKVRPGLEATFEARGFKALGWFDFGWVRIFSRNPVASPDDLRRQKLFQYAGDGATLEIWKRLGFNAIPAPGTELATGLQTGLLDAFFSSPEVVLLARFYQQAPNMTDLRWAMILGGTVLTRQAWDRIPAGLRPALEKAALDAAARLREEGRAGDERDLQALRRAGLKVVPVDARAREVWRKAVAGAAGLVRGTFAPAQAYDEALRARDAWRRASGK